MKVVFAGRDMAYQDTTMEGYVKDVNKQHLDNLIFTGDLGRDEMDKVIANARLVVLPSLWEAFGFVCLESISLGKPTIASSGSGFDEIIKDNETGFTVKPGDSFALSEKIIKCLGKDLNRVSKYAWKRANRFDVDKIAKEVLEFYREVANE